MNKLKRFLIGSAASAMILSNTIMPVGAAEPWDVTGNYDISFQLTGDPTTYTHDATLTQTGASVDGTGGYPATGPFTYTWDITSGNVTNSTINLTVSYLTGAVGTTMLMTGTIAANGTMSGTWSDNLDNGSRTGTWMSTDGAAQTAVTPSPTVTVTIDKYIDGTKATATSANNSAFPMRATWNATNIGAGTGSYDLDADGFNGNPTPYQAITSEMTSGANYTTNEVTGGSVVGANCTIGQPYALVGYTTGNNLSEAQGGTPSATTPNFTNITSNKYVIVWNMTCPVTPPPHAELPAQCDQNTVYNVIEGTSASEVLNGTNGPDLILARGGSDAANGKGGNDCIVGGNGSDHLVGGDGADVILGGAGSDSINGNDGADKLYGGADSDAIRGNDGADQLFGEGGSDSLQGNGGVDTANGGANSDACTAEVVSACEA